MYRRLLTIASICAVALTVMGSTAAPSLARVPAVRATASAAVAPARVGATAATALHAGTMNWPTYGGDGANMRYAPVAQITTANVGRLRLAWSFHTGVMGPKSSFEATPIVADGRMFVTAPDD